MNRIENILLALATAAAFLLASTANADSGTNPNDGLPGISVVKTPTGTRPARDLELEEANADSGTKPEDGLPGIPVVKTPNGTRMARDLELEEANADSGTKPEDGLPGRPVIRTPNGTRTARDLEAEHANDPCPKNGDRSDTRTAERGRTSSANEAGSLLQHNDGLPLDLNGTRTKDSELADRGAAMGSLKDAAKRNQNKNTKSAKNTTLGRALTMTGIDPKRLKGAKTETTESGSTKITLSDGTVIWTGPDSDGFGTSVTEPNGDETQVYPDGTVSRRNVKNPKSNTITRKPDGTTIVHDGAKDTLTITDKDGNTITRPMKFFDQLNKTDMTYDDLMDLLFPGRKGGAANGGKNSKHPKRNTTLDDALKNAGLNRDALKDATSIKPSEHSGSIEITLKDGTVIWTGPDSDGMGSSVTKPNGDQIETFPGGRVIKSNVNNP